MTSLKKYFAYADVASFLPSSPCSSFNTNLPRSRSRGPIYGFANAELQSP